MFESIVFSLYIFVLGLFVGSFLNVLVDRLPTGENPFAGRSRCDKCKHALSPLDLIPIISFILLDGKCRYCKHKLSSYYPLVELMTGLLFFIVGFVVLNGPNVNSLHSINLLIFYLIFNLVLISALIVIFFTDLKFGIIPFSAVAVGLVSTILIHILVPNSVTTIQNYLLSATVMFLFFLLLFLITRGRGMGFGDVVYAFLMGFVLGYPNVVLGIYIAVLSGAVIPLVVLGLKHKKIRGTTIPFGPFLVAGTLVSLFWGDMLVPKILSYLFK